MLKTNKDEVYTPYQIYILCEESSETVHLLTPRQAISHQHLLNSNEVHKVKWPVRLMTLAICKIIFCLITEYSLSHLHLWSGQTQSDLLLGCMLDKNVQRQKWTQAWLHLLIVSIQHNYSTLSTLTAIPGFLLWGQMNALPTRLLALGSLNSHLTVNKFYITDFKSST